MKTSRSKIGKAIALAMLVSAMSFALITPHRAGPWRSLVLAGQADKKVKLPSGAVIIEEQSLGSAPGSGGHPDRALILWMVNPVRNPSGALKDPAYLYTCLDQTRGSHYSGATRVSLLNTKTRTILNT